MKKRIYSIFILLAIITVALALNGKFAPVMQVNAKHDDSTPTNTPTPTLATLKVTICHYDSGQGGKYTSNTVSINSVSDCQNAGGHDGHSNDIIPSYTYGTCTYNGKNWNTSGQAIWNNGCVVPTSTPTTVPTVTTVPTTVPTVTTVPTTVPTVTVVPTVTNTPTATPTTNPCVNEQNCVTPTATPTATPTPTPTNTPNNGEGSNGGGNNGGDGRSDGLSSCPQCTQAPQSNSQGVLGVSTQALLGASTMAGTGTFNTTLMNLMAIFGMIALSAGALSYAKEKRA